MSSVGEQTVQDFREAFSGTGARDPGIGYCGHVVADRPCRRALAAPQAWQQPQRAEPRS